MAIPCPLITFAAGAVLACGAALTAEVPLSGDPVAGMEAVDRAYAGFMETHGIPGGSVAIMKDGELVYARGFGWADRETKQPVTADTVFRIASISKPITALVVMHLIEQGKLDYHTRAFPYLGYPTPEYEGAARDPRLDTITVEQLLQHSAGWDRATATNPDGGTHFDPMFWTTDAARDLSGRPAPPATAEEVARWMVGKPLQFDPGSRYAYSNLGYCVLGRMIEKASGQNYESYLTTLLARAGIKSMAIGGSKHAELRENETRYYDHPDATLAPSVWGEKLVPGPHRFSNPTLDAHGGWIATASDLLKFTTLLDGRPDPKDLIGEASRARIIAPPAYAPPATEDGRNYYGLGWSIRELSDGTSHNWFHSGSLPGTMAMLIRADNGLTWAALFNLRPRESQAAFKDLDRTMWKAVNGVEQWPTR